MTDDIFAPIQESITNQRKAVRYTSSASVATVTFKPLFRARQHINIKLINISSKGVRIHSKYNFSCKSNVIFNLKIKGKPTWKVSGKIVRLYGHSEFGIAFDTIQHPLIDQLIANNTDFSIA